MDNYASEDTAALAEFRTFSKEEIDKAVQEWQSEKNILPRIKPRVHPLVPSADSRNILICSALPYVNNVPHLGNIIGCVLSADTFSRYCRLRGYNSIYICGTDEYGTATETKALEEKVSPRELCDKYNEIHKNVYKWFNIDFDYFGRTSTEQQTAICQDIFWKLHQQGMTVAQSMEQLYCGNCKRFLADRYVEGNCPHCNEPGCRGDQCDKCGKLINATDLKEPQCKQCGTKPEIRSSEHLFLDLPKMQSELVKYYETVFETGIWTHNAKEITRSWLHMKEGLKPRCITRDLTWGVPVPLEGYQGKVFYVWFDAPIGYISITANYTSEWEKWWKNSEQVELINFLGKDNVAFHSVIFPSTLLGAKDNYTIVKHMSATEYLNYEQDKFSKSRGVGVFGTDAQLTGIDSDIYRFYLLFVRPEDKDADFSWADLVLKNNTELLANIGNFINRALKFLDSNFGGIIPEMHLNAKDYELLANIHRELVDYLYHMEHVNLRDGLRNILSISSSGNKMLQDAAPWKLVKGTDDDKARAGTVIGLAANMCLLISILLEPFMPESRRKIQKQLNAPDSCYFLHDYLVCQLKTGHKIGAEIEPLFRRIEEKTAEELRKQFAGTKPKNTVLSTEDIAKLKDECEKQGAVVRDLKSKQVPKEEIDKELSKLLDLKKRLTLSGAGDASAEKKKSGGKKVPVMVKEKVSENGSSKAS